MLSIVQSVLTVLIAWTLEKFAISIVREGNHRRAAHCVSFFPPSQKISSGASYARSFTNFEFAETAHGVNAVAQFLQAASTYSDLLLVVFAL